MSFDAGSITAELAIGTAKADADLRKIEDRVKALESGRHEVKVSAVFDTASIGKARAAFAALDNAVSRDAMQRLRSSPQGSVLGALTALFSPHPVTGAPSPQQAASQGLLGRMFAPQGGGSTPVSGGSGGTGTVRDIITGQNAPQKVTVTQAGGGGGSAGAEQAAADLKQAAAQEKDAAGRMRDSAGRFASAAGKAGEAADEQKSAARDLSGASAGVRGVFDSLRKLFGGGGGGSGGGGGKAAGAFAGNLAGGIGPGILGLGIKQAGIIGGAGALLGSLPALLAPLAALGVGGAGAGVIELGARQLIGTKNVKGQPATQGPLYAQAQQVKSVLQNVMQGAASVLAKPLQAAFADIPGMLKGIEPALKSVFAGAGTLIQPLLDGLNDIAHMVLPALGQAFRATAPLLEPLLDGFGRLISGLLPGITTLLHAAMPAVTAFSQILGTLGKDLGGLFAALAPAVKASVQIFQPLTQVLGALFPIVGKLAAVFAQALGPVFTQFAGVVEALMPALTIIGKVLASLAGAILGDLVSAFTAVASLLKGIAPALTTFATALSSAFTVLENTGVFAELGDALEKLAPLLAQMISQLLNGLTPVLPALITGLSQMSTIIVTALTNGLQQILPPLTQLALVVLQALAASLPVVLPVLGKVFAFFTMAAADAITAIVKALSGLVNALPKPVLDTLAGLAATLLILKKTGVISLGIKIVGAAQKLLSWLTGTTKAATVDVAAGGMQKAGDTMLTAAAAMQRAADTMAGAGVAGGVAGEAGAGAAAGAAGAEEAGTAGAAGLTGLAAGLGAVLLPLAAGAVIAGIIKAAQKNAPMSAFLSNLLNQSGSKFQAQNISGAQKQMASDISQITSAFSSEAKGAAAASGALQDYTEAVKANGAGSQAAEKAREALIASLVAAGVNSVTALRDVTAYTTAVQQNGVTSQAAQGAREQLLKDILGAGSNAAQGRRDLDNFTIAVRDNGADSQAAQGARAKLIKDLENAGLSAQQATQLVDGLSSSIGKLKSVHVSVTMTGDGTYTIAEQQAAAGGQQIGRGGAPAKAAGGMITEGTTGTADDVNIRASRGEYVVRASSVSKYGTGMMDAINAGAFASGGQVGGNLTPGYVSGMYGAFRQQMTDSMVSAMRAAIKAAEAAAEARARQYGSNAGPAGGDAAANAALARSMYPAWASGALWNAWNYVATRESGWNRFARNPQSGAYGIPQALPESKLPPAGRSSGGSHAGPQISWMHDYMIGRYGGPEGAAAHEQADNWYAAGGPVGGGWFPGWLGGWMPGRGGWGGGFQGLGTMLSGISGGSAGPGAPGPWGSFAGDYTGVVSPAGGGFGLTRADLGLPATDTSGAGGTAGSSSPAPGTGTPAPPKAKAPAKPSLNAAQKAAIAVLERLMGGLIRDNKTGEAAQANALLNSLGVTKYNHQLNQITFLDGLLAKARSKAAKTAAERLLESFGVHAFTPHATAKGNAPQSAVITRMESLVRAAITANNMTAAGQANSILTALGTGKYTSELSQIGHLDSLLAQYKKKKDTRDIAATEALLRTYGVRHFAQGGTVWEPVTGVGHNSGRVYQFAENGPEHVTPGAGTGGGDTSALLSRICSQLDTLTGVAAAIPRGTGEHVGAALGGAAQAASFSRRYTHGGS